MWALLVSLNIILEQRLACSFLYLQLPACGPSRVEALGGQQSPRRLQSLAEAVGPSPPEESVGRAQESGLHPGGGREPLKDSEEAAEWPQGAGEVGAPAPPGATHPIWMRLLVANSCEATWALLLVWPALLPGSRTSPTGPGAVPLPNQAAALRQLERRQAPCATKLPAGQSPGCP